MAEAKFYGSYRKVERAQKHISDIEAIVLALPKRYTASIETNPHGGNKVIKHDLRDREKYISDIALLTGDAVHNLKCALDYAWSDIVKRTIPLLVGKFSKFPVYPSQNELEGVLRGREIDVSSPTLFNCIVSDIQAYAGGNDFLYGIHKMDIFDKHRLLMPVVEFGAIDGIKLQDQKGKIYDLGTWPTSQHPPYYVPIEKGLHIKDKGQVSVEVLFQDGVPLYDLEVIGTLTSCSEAVLNALGFLEQF